MSRAGRRLQPQRETRSRQCVSECDTGAGFQVGTVRDGTRQVFGDVTLLTSQHGLEHALSAYHPNLPHGAGLIMISKAYFSYFVRNHGCDDRFVEQVHLLGMHEAAQPEDFITALVRLQEACGVADLKMSDYGIFAESYK